AAGTMWGVGWKQKRGSARQKSLCRVAGKQSVTYIDRVGHRDRKHQDQGAKKCGSSGATLKRDNRLTRTSPFVSPRAKSEIPTVRSCFAPKTSRFPSNGRKSPPTCWRK